MQTTDTPVLTMRDHVENNINEENVVVQPHWNENYEPVPLYSLVEPQDQQNQEYEQIKPCE